MSCVMLGFDWPAVAVRLKVRGEWDMEVEDGLSICERVMMNVEESERKSAND